MRQLAKDFGAGMLQVRDAGTRGTDGDADVIGSAGGETGCLLGIGWGNALCTVTEIAATGTLSCLDGLTLPSEF